MCVTGRMIHLCLAAPISSSLRGTSQSFVMETSGTGVTGLVFASSLPTGRTPITGSPRSLRIARAMSSIGAPFVGPAGWCSGFGRLRSARVPMLWHIGLLKPSGLHASRPESERLEQPALLMGLGEAEACAPAEVGAKPNIGHFAGEFGGNSRDRVRLEEAE